MFYKTRKAIDFLEQGNIQIFDIQSSNEADLLRHSENINGTTVQTIIMINNSPITEVVYIIGQCKDKQKHTQLVFLMNELNCDRRICYSIREDGLITATFYYYATDDDFNASTLFQTYVAFLDSLHKNNDISQIMKTIWS